LFATIAASGETHPGILLQADFTGPVYSQFQYTGHKASLPFPPIAHARFPSCAAA